jgi:uncharacterized protein YcbX
MQHSPRLGLVEEGSIREFAEAAIEHGRFPDQRANPHADRIATIGRALRDAASLEQLIPLTSHENASVRVWAATYLLEVDPAEAERVLEEVVQERADLVGFGAQQTLYEWRQGRLKLP